MRQLGTTAPVFLFAGLLLAANPAPAQTTPSEHEAHRLHGDSAAYIAALEDPARDAWQKPHEVIDALGIKSGERIADIGAGSGYFALRFARHVGARGRVLRGGREPGHARAPPGAGEGRRASRTCRTCSAPPDDPLLPAGSVDRVFFCDVWHHVDDQAGYLEKLKKALRPGGTGRDDRLPQARPPGGPATSR